MAFNSARRAILVVVLALVAACTDAVHGSDSTVVWQRPGVVSTQPIVFGPNIIAAFDDGRVAALNRKTGAVAWERSFTGAFQSERLLLSGSRIIIPQYSLRALDGNTGQTLWTYDGPRGGAGAVTPAVAGDTIFPADHVGGRAAALDAATGRPYWGTDLNAALFTPTVTDSLVLYPTRNYVGGPWIGPLGAGYLVALDRRTGAKRWQVSLPDSVGFQSSGGATNGGLIVGDAVILGTVASQVMAIRLSDGHIIWKRASGSPPRAPYLTSAALYDGLAVFIRGDGLLEGRSPTTGELLWSTATGGASTYRPLPCAPYLCMGRGQIWVIGSRGNIVWAYGGLTPAITFLSAPTVDDANTIFIGGDYDNNNPQFIAIRPPIRLGATP